MMGGTMILFLVQVFGLMYGTSAQDYANDADVQLFQEYIRINTTTGPGNCDAAVTFWTGLADEMGWPISFFEFVEGYQMAVITIEGSDPTLPGIMLNSHMDVVPANQADGWTYPPFNATLDSDGVIWGRGTQDMKSVGIQYYLALRNLKANNVTLQRNIYLTFMPDEEIGGQYGMKPFLASENFTALNIGLEMDEGRPYTTDEYAVFYHDKPVWQLQVNCYGQALHGALFPMTNVTASGKCASVIDSLLAFRDTQYPIAAAAPYYDSSEYTSVNLNRLNGGTANNVIPQYVSLTFDIRLALAANETEFQEQLDQWMSDAGSNVNITYIVKDPQTEPTALDSSNIFWSALSDAGTTLNITLLPSVPPGATDARHVRATGLPAFGFSPMPKTDVLVHGINERLSAETFLNGISVYETVITSLANVADSDSDETTTTESDYDATTETDYDATTETDYDATTESDYDATTESDYDVLAC